MIINYDKNEPKSNQMHFFSKWLLFFVQDGKYAGLKEALSIEGWHCGLYMIEVGARGHISNLVKDRLRYFFRSWVPPGQKSGVTQMIKYASISGSHWPCLDYSRFCLSSYRWGASKWLNVGSFGPPLPPSPPEKKTKKRGSGMFCFWHIVDYTCCFWSA
jgi:hypothetical protein